MGEKEGTSAHTFDELAREITGVLLFAEMYSIGSVKAMSFWIWDLPGHRCGERIAIGFV
jgi:hypothetical protein